MAAEVHKYTTKRVDETKHSHETIPLDEQIANLGYMGGCIAILAVTIVFVLFVLVGLTQIIGISAGTKVLHRTVGAEVATTDYHRK